MTAPLAVAPFADLFGPPPACGRVSPAALAAIIIATAAFARLAWSNIQ